MQSLILHCMFLINCHYIVEICFHFDIKEFFFVNSCQKSQIMLTMIPFIKAIKGENIQGGEYFL